MKRYIVTEEQLSRLWETCYRNFMNQQNVKEAFEECRAIELPNLDPLRLGIVTSEQIDQVIALLRRAFPLEEDSGVFKETTDEL